RPGVVRPAPGRGRGRREARPARGRLAEGQSARVGPLVHALAQPRRPALHLERGDGVRNPGPEGLRIGRSPAAEQVVRRQTRRTFLAMPRLIVQLPLSNAWGTDGEIAARDELVMALREGFRAHGYGRFRGVEDGAGRTNLVFFEP